MNESLPVNVFQKDVAFYTTISISNDSKWFQIKFKCLKIAIVSWKFPYSNYVCAVCTWAYLFQDDKMFCSKFSLLCTGKQCSYTWQLNRFRGLKCIYSLWKDYLNGQFECLGHYYIGDLIRMASFSTISTIKFISILKYHHVVQQYLLSISDVSFGSANMCICVSIQICIYVACML